MSDAERNETELAGLPVPLAERAPRPSLARSSAEAAFVSQLLAARDRMPPQRQRRSATNERAIGAYGRGARLSERRMPLGYRKTMVV
jgi:hypothetical protein